MKAPWGHVLLADKGNGLFLLELNNNPSSDIEGYFEEKFGLRAHEDTKLFRDLKIQLEEYFQGKKQKFSCNIDLSSGTDFQKKVWKTLSKIPYGKSLSYSEVAQKMGHPGAARAVGGACGKNPVPIIIPCHRVLGTKGDLGGFSSGLSLKQTLLKLENIPFNFSEGRVYL